MDKIKMIHVSNMTGKLEGIKAVNTNTLTNEFCKRRHRIDNPLNICRSCYSVRQLKTYRKNCTKKWEENSKVLSEGIIPWDDLPRTNEIIMRLHGHGELINMDHLVNFTRLAKKNPDTTFALWTKKAPLVGEYERTHEELPPNMVKIFSNPNINKIMESPPKNFDRVFNNVDGEFEDS